MKRRTWLIAGAGAGAALAGIGWRGFSDSRRQAHVHASTGGLWQMSFERPRSPISRVHPSCSTCGPPTVRRA